MSLIQAIILAIVEALTEFLPVSSTGHMVLVSSFMGISQDEFTKIFNVCIQFGAILSVVVLYWKKFFTSIEFYTKLFAAFLPGAIMGLLFNDLIDDLLENVYVVATTLLLGGIILVFVDKWFNDKDASDDINIPYLKAFIIGCFQCIAMVPGVSRSAATIIGGMTQKLTRKAAAEFSFFLAVPTMFAATVLKLYKGYQLIQSEHISILIVGNIVAFVGAMLAIKFFISFLTKNGFKIFGYYRIALGLLILILAATGVKLQVH